MRGGAHHDHADAVGFGVAHDGVGRVAVFQHVVRHLMAVQLQAHGPVFQHGQHLAVQRGFALAGVGCAGGAGRHHSDHRQPRAGADAERAADRLAQ